MTVYRAQVGNAVARWLADPARSPLGPAGFYQTAIIGVITDMGGGWVEIDGTALEALRGLPDDRDGHVTDEDGPILWVGKTRHPLMATTRE